MNETALARTNGAEVLEQVIIQGDLAHLSAEHRVVYYRKVCESLGLNYLTKPFDYIELNGKLTLYAKRDATDQLRNSQHVSVKIVSREKIDDIYVVMAHAELPNGRTDESIAALPCAPLAWPHQSRVALLQSIIQRAGVLLVSAHHAWRWTRGPV